MAILIAPAATMQRQNSASVMPLVHCVQMCAEAKFRHHHINVVWEIALDELGLGAAFVARHSWINLFARPWCRPRLFKDRKFVLTCRSPSEAGYFHNSKLLAFFHPS
jgi:hypothetical protein